MPSLFRCRSSLFALVLVAFAASAAAQAPGEPPVRVYVLGQEKLAVIDDASFSMLATIPLPTRTVSWWFSEDGSRLSVVSQEGIFRIKEPARLTVIDLASLKTLASHPLDFHFQSAIKSKDGKTGYALFAGRPGKKGGEHAPPSLVRVDSASGKPAARRELVQVPASYLLTSDESGVVLIDRGELAMEPSKRRPARLQILDAATLEPRASLDLPGPCADVFWNEDRSLLYLLDTGIDHKQPERALPGRVYVVDPLAASLVADLDVGAGPGPLSWDPQKGVFYILTRPRKTREAAASLQVLERDRIVKELALPRLPRSVVPAPDRSRFYVLEDAGITLVDGAVETIEGKIPLKRPAGNLILLDPPTRGYVLHPDSGVVSAVDLQARQVLAEVTTGRTGVKIGKWAAAVAATTLSGLNAQMLYGSYALGQVVTVPPAQTGAFVASDGKTVYIHNSQTNDLTAIDTETQKVLGMFAAGRDLHTVLDGRYLAAPKPGELVLVDLAARQPLPQMEVPGMTTFCPHGRHAYSLGMRGLAVIDLEKKTIVKNFPEVPFGSVHYHLESAGTPGD